MNFEEFKLRVKGVLDTQSKMRPLRVHDLKSARDRVIGRKIPPVTYGMTGPTWPLEEGDDLDNINPDSIRLMLQKVIDMDGEGEVQTFELIDNREGADEFPTIVDDSEEQDFRDALMLLDEIMGIGERFLKNNGKVNKKWARDFRGYLDSVELFLDQYTMDAKEIKEVRNGRDAVEIG